MPSTELKEGLLFALGNPLLDIIASTDEEFLKKYDLKPNNAILAEDKHAPMYTALVQNYPVEYIAGGASQNSMRIAQWILNKPNVTTYMGCIGKDSFGEVLESKASEAGVNVKYQYSQSVSTGTCAVVLTGKERSLVANLSAANHFTKDHLVKTENKALMEKAQYYYITGFFLTVSPDSIMEVVTHANQHNKIVTMNLSAPFLCQLFKDPMMKAFPYVDILFSNETEAATFAEVQNLGTKDLKEIALKITNLPKENKRSRMVVITQGELPVIVASDGNVKEYPVESLKPSEIIDTNGAGDAFVGGFLAQYIQKKPIELCIKCAIWAATHIIKQSGCAYDKNQSFQE